MRKSNPTSGHSVHILGCFLITRAKCIPDSISRSADLNIGDKHETFLFFFFSFFPAPLRSSPQAYTALHRRMEEKLAEAEQEVVRTGAEAALLRTEVQRLREEKKEKGEEELKEQLSRHVGRMSRELEELRAEHRVAG